MKSFFAVVRILLTVFVMVNAYIDPEITREAKDTFKGIIRSCSEHITRESFIKMIVDLDVHGMDIQAKCFTACALSHIGLMKEGKLHMEKIEEKVNSMIDASKSCAEEANQNANECDVAGKFGECLKRLDM